MSATIEDIEKMDAAIEAANKPRHNHKKVFGRYIVGCPACIAKYPDGPPEKKAKVAEIEKAAAQQGISLEQLLAFARELKSPDPEVQREKDAAKQRLLAAKQNERQVEAERVARIAASQRACGAAGHKQNGGRSQQSAISGQMHSDGLFHGICVSCQWTFTRKPTIDEMGMGSMNSMA